MTGLRGRGLRVADTDANFVLFGRFGDRPPSGRRLLDHGVLVRDVGLPGWLRVSAGTAGRDDGVPAGAASSATRSGQRGERAEAK